jgi:hypothetical protein
VPGKRLLLYLYYYIRVSYYYMCVFRYYTFGAYYYICGAQTAEVDRLCDVRRMLTYADGC